MTQRYLTSLDVFDTYIGLPGKIIQASLSPTVVLDNPFTPLYTGLWLVVQFNDTSLQLFTDSGQIVDHTTGAIAYGVTLLTWNEYNALATAGYPV